MRYVSFGHFVLMFTSFLSSYLGFEEAWNDIAASSPGWKSQWPKKLYQIIVYVSLTIFWKLIFNMFCSQDFVHLPSGSGAVKKPLPAINFQKLNAGLSGDAEAII
jgi:hypothetical protein